MNVLPFPVSNYLIPSAGGTSCVELSGVFSATPFTQDWRQYSIDNAPFTPQGVFIDNTQGTGDLVIIINPIGYQIKCPAGVSAQAQFPAPMAQSCSITGLGQAGLYFVNFPVLPNAGLIDIGNQVGVSIDAIKAGLSVPVLVPTNSSGNPYQIQKTVLIPTLETGTITTATSATVTPPANSNLRKLNLDLTENASIASAGIVTITATLNGVVVAKKGVYLPATAGGNIGITDIFQCDFSDIAFNTGASGTFVVTLSTALATGQLDFNAYFA